MSEPEIIQRGTPLDFELAELLGQEPMDFIILCFDGKQFEGYGTPHDSPRQRIAFTEFVARLNDRSKDSSWPEFYSLSNALDYGDQKYQGVPDEDRPDFSWKIHRVCHGYSKYLHAAIGLFDKLPADKVLYWSVSQENGCYFVCVNTHRAKYTEEGQDLSLLICLVIKRVLIDFKEEQPTP